MNLEKGLRYEKYNSHIKYKKKLQSRSSRCSNIKIDNDISKKLMQNVDTDETAILGSRSK